MTMLKTFENDLNAKLYEVLHGTIIRSMCGDHRIEKTASGELILAPATARLVLSRLLRADGELTAEKPK